MENLNLAFWGIELIPSVVVVCLIIGYCIKHIEALDKISNQYIPAILAVLGAIFGCIVTGKIEFLTIVSGALSGLTSTGLHQTFKAFIEKGQHTNTPVDGPTPGSEQ